MRILLAIIHYFAAEADPKHSSVDAAGMATRRAVTRGVIERYRGLFGRPAALEMASRTIHRLPGGGDTLDIAIITMPGCSLLDGDFLARHAVRAVEVRPENPRMLGFFAHELFARLRGAYDMFAFSEDDLLPADPDLFAKAAWFAARSGGRRVLSPNRFEWNAQGRAIKTYIDGDLGPKMIDPLIALHRDDDAITLEAFDRPRTFRRARNPHAGFFAITQAQLGHWMRQPHWLDRNCGFVSPLESAATLGLAQAFPIYKPFGSSAAFLELEHADTRYSSFDWPMAPGGLGG